MPDINNIRLEYKEEKGQFHCEWNNTHQPNTFGWQTVAENVKPPMDSVFCTVMQFIIDKKKKKPSIKEIREEYQKFEWYIDNLKQFKLIK